MKKYTRKLNILLFQKLKNPKKIVTVIAQVKFFTFQTVTTIHLYENISICYCTTFITSQHFNYIWYYLKKTKQDTESDKFKQSKCLIVKLTFSHFLNFSWFQFNFNFSVFFNVKKPKKNGKFKTLTKLHMEFRCLQRCRNWVTTRNYVIWFNFDAAVI